MKPTTPALLSSILFLCISIVLADDESDRQAKMNRSEGIRCSTGDQALDRSNISLQATEFNSNLPELSDPAIGGGLANSNVEDHTAIVGEGFFEVVMPDGTLAYTRTGNFRISDSRRVVTKDGLSVLSGFQPFPQSTLFFAVSSRGVVTLSGPAGTTNFQIHLIRFRNPAGLESIEPDLFRANEESGPAEAGNPGENGYGEIGQGLLHNAGSFGFKVQMPVSYRWANLQISTGLVDWTTVAQFYNPQYPDETRIMVRELTAIGLEARFYRMRHLESNL